MRLRRDATRKAFASIIIIQHCHCRNCYRRNLSVSWPRNRCTYVFLFYFLFFIFTGLIEEGYHSTNPYHNAIHATDVTQAMHCFLQEDKVSIGLAGFFDFFIVNLFKKLIKNKKFVNLTRIITNIHAKTWAEKYPAQRIDGASCS